MWELIGKIAVGSLLVRIGWMILKGLYGSFIGSVIGLNTNLKKMGKWAGKQLKYFDTICKLPILINLFKYKFNNL